MKKIVLVLIVLLNILAVSAQEEEYPTAKVEKHDVAILVIDMQNDFVDPKGKLCVAGAKATIPDIQKLLSAFFHTNLDDMLRRMGVKTVVLCGTQYPNCVRGTANDAMSYDYETIIDTDACSAKTPEVAASNVFDMKNMGIKCLSLKEIQERYK